MDIGSDSKLITKKYQIHLLEVTSRLLLSMSTRRVGSTPRIVQLLKDCSRSALPLSYSFRANLFLAFFSVFEGL